MSEGPVHFRRCHLCGCMNEQREGKVEKCHNCNKVLAPFYYFDDRFTPVRSDGGLRPPQADNEFQHLVGITVFWENLEPDEQRLDKISRRK